MKQWKTCLPIIVGSLQERSAQISPINSVNIYLQNICNNAVIQFVTANEDLAIAT